ncbi:MAG: hypothetical protein LBP73_11060 [Clostridiales Family XIII bacterium]|jgi:hypothetical protein|nr:hypothetical protein [Clostridiales Family XIII bacterium]
MAGLRLPVALLFIASCCLPASCAGGGASAQNPGLTAEYRSFLAVHETDSSVAVRESSGGYRFTLEAGRLCVTGADNAEIWRSKDEWYVDSFQIGDVNCDRILDVVFVVWKSYSFGAEHPARMANEDAAVRCHLFVYSINGGRAKPLWCSSNLPRPIYSFALHADGERTPTLSGVRLTVCEGAYTEDYSKTASTEHTYAWNGWGFSPVEAP